MKQDFNLPTRPTRFGAARFGAALAAVLLAGTIAASPAFAAGGGGSSGASSDTHSCKDGMHWSKSANRCVTNGSSQLDEDLYQEGHDLALAGHYRQALASLSAVKNKDSMTLTMIGYANRKMGNVDEGMAFYQKALALNSGNINTHEYLGEGYVAIGRPELAKVELGKLEALCGTECEQYQDLAKAIAGGAVE